MKVYISGPMQGIPEFNYPVFFAAERWLVSQGYEVVNPAALTLPVGADQENGAITFEDHCTYMRLDITDILEVGGIVLLDGWEMSSGANIELVVARALGLEVWRWSPNFDGPPRFWKAHAVPGPKLEATMHARAEGRLG